MKLVMSLGCIRLKMLPEEAINAVTINSAYAMGLSETHGSITRGKVANVFITKQIPSYEFMPYAFGSNLIETVILRGNIINDPSTPPDQRSTPQPPYRGANALIRKKNHLNIRDLGPL
jgi:imidazolonepropionase-like amidohydrolase